MKSGLINRIVEPYFLYCSVWVLLKFNTCIGFKRGPLELLQTVLMTLLSSLFWKNGGENYTAADFYAEQGYNLAPKYLSKLLNKNSACTSRSLRNINDNIRLPRIKVAQGQKLFLSWCKVWNSLTVEAKLTSSLRKFKKTI